MKIPRRFAFTNQLEFDLVKFVEMATELHMFHTPGIYIVSFHVRDLIDYEVWLKIPGQFDLRMPPNFTWSNSTKIGS